MKVIVVGGGAAGMMEPSGRRKKETKLRFWNKTKNLERSCLSLEKGGVM